MATKEMRPTGPKRLDVTVARATSVRHRVDRVCRLAEQARHDQGDANIAAGLIRFAELDIERTRRVLKSDQRDDMDDIQRTLAGSALEDITTGEARVESARTATGTRPTSREPEESTGLLGELAALTGEMEHHRNQTANGTGRRMQMAHARAATECHEMLAHTAAAIAAESHQRSGRELAVLNQMGTAIRNASLDYEETMSMRREMAELQISPELEAIRESDLVRLADEFRKTDEPVAMVPATQGGDREDRMTLIILYDDEEYIRVKEAGEQYPPGTAAETAEEHARYMLDAATAMTEQPRDENDLIAGQLMMQQCIRTHNLAARGMHCADLNEVADALEKAGEDAAIGKSGRRSMGASLAADPDTTRSILGPDPAKLVSHEQAKAIMDAAEAAGVELGTVLELAELLGVNPLMMGYARPILTQRRVDEITADLLEARVLPTGVARALQAAGATEQQVKTALLETEHTGKTSPVETPTTDGPRLARLNDVFSDSSGEPEPARTTPGGLILA